MASVKSNFTTVTRTVERGELTDGLDDGSELPVVRANAGVEFGELG